MTTVSPGHAEADLSALPEAVVALREDPAFMARYLSDDGWIRKAAIAKMEEAFKSGSPATPPATASAAEAAGDEPAAEVVSTRSEYSMETFGDADPGEAAKLIEAAQDHALPASLFNAASEMVARLGPDHVVDAEAVGRNYASVKASMPEGDFKLAASYLKALDAANPIFGDALDRLLSNASTATWTFKQAALLAQRR
ncbi:MAG: hypothetical protein GEU91_19175 [Rhizobiales bacterium]|nr:hypothetical protein [Hyphomicrobiales bacterium]